MLTLSRSTRLLQDHYAWQLLHIKSNYPFIFARVKDALFDFSVIEQDIVTRARFTSIKINRVCLSFVLFLHCFSTGFIRLFT